MEVLKIYLEEQILHISIYFFNSFLSLTLKNIVLLLSKHLTYESFEEALYIIVWLHHYHCIQ